MAQFTDEQRREAVRVFLRTGERRTAARVVGCSERSVTSWVRAAAADGSLDELRAELGAALAAAGALPPVERAPSAAPPAALVDHVLACRQGVQRIVHMLEIGLGPMEMLKALDTLSRLAGVLDRMIQGATLSARLGTLLLTENEVEAVEAIVRERRANAGSTPAEVVARLKAALADVLPDLLPEA